MRYSGNLLGSALEDWRIVLLSGGYAIVTLPQEEIDRLAALPQVEYVEKPKRLFFSVDAGRAASCISPVQTGDLELFGAGVLVAVIDSGVDYFHADFRKEDGRTRIVAMWDQTAVLDDDTGQRVPPSGFLQGLEYTEEDLNQALAANSREEALKLVPEFDAGGHGTQVLGIAAGNGRASGGRYRGVAPQSELIVVKMGMPKERSFPRTTELMQAVEYVIRKAEQRGKPVVLNLSFGNVYGSHRGTSLLETYLDMMAARGRNVICVGTGNEGNTAGHRSGRLLSNQEENIELLIGDFELSLSIQIWKNYVDEFQVTFVHPDGGRIGPLGEEIGASRYSFGNTQLLVYYGEPSPYQGQQEIYIEFLPEKTYLDSGSWRIILSPGRIVTGDYAMWLSDSAVIGSGTRFVHPTADATMTIPSTAQNVIAVGAYDARLRMYAPFSGRGWINDPYNIRPDLVAPGVDITTTAPGGGYVSVTGTSFATPFVTGAAALLMQWGIVQGNDPYLYGEKVKAYLRRGARQLPGFEVWPNNQVGYGALCVGDSIPFD